MIAKKRALLLVGSPKGPGSTSDSIGTYLVDRLRVGSFDTEKFRIHPSIRSDKGRENLISAIDECDVLILAFPLYVDSLPSPVIRAMEFVARHRNSAKQFKRQGFLAISNSGFPEAHHNKTALAICRRFALESGFEWLGGLALGGGQAVDGRPLGKLGGMARNIRKSLDLTASALIEGRPIPEEAVSFMAKPITPVWMYTWFGELRWKRQARKHGVKNRLYDRPYQDE